MNPGLMEQHPAPERTDARRSGDMVALPPNEVALWWAELDHQTTATVQELQALLSADEADRASRFHFERDRRRYQVGRGILRSLLGRYLGFAPREIAFTYGRYGKPSLAPGLGSSDESRLEFNVAHSEGLALFAFTRGAEIGVDLEHIRDLPEWERLAESWFAPRDVARLAGLRPELRRDEFFRLWTRTEAGLKVSGVGLGGEVAPADDRGHDVFSLPLAAGFAAAVASSGGREWATFQLWHPEPRWPADLPRRARRIRLTDTALGGPTFL